MTFEQSISTARANYEKLGGPIQYNATANDICRDLGWNLGSDFDSCGHLFVMIALDGNEPEMWLDVPNEAPIVWVSGLDGFGDEEGFLEAFLYLEAHREE